MRMNTPFGRAMYLVSLVVAVGMIVLMWTYFADQPVVFKAFFTVFVVAICAWNGRLAFGPDRPSR